jgi:uncharacterized protein (UPF0276 family)
MLYLSTSSVRTRNIIEAVEQLSAITKNIELSGGSLYSENLLEGLLSLKRGRGINFLIHSYFPPPKERFILNFADTSEKTRSFIKEVMRFVNSLDVDYYSIHAGFKKEFTFDNSLLSESGSEKVFMADGIGSNLKWFKEEFPDKKIAFENLYPNNHNTECCFMIHVDEIISLLEKFPDIYFLLDLGHLKVSSQLLDFDYLNSVELLFERYSNRILEIHLSENNSNEDNHFILYPDSIQYKIIKDYASMIKENRINITIESRNSTIRELSDCFMRVNNIISTTQ